MNTDSDREYLAGLRSRRTTVAAQLEKLTVQVSALDKAISGLAALIEDDDDDLLSAPGDQATNERKPQRAMWEEVQALMREQEDKSGMQIADMVAALKARGITINSPTPGNIVFSAMSRRPEVFVKLQRGVWGLVEDDRELAALQQAARLDPDL